MKLFSKTKPVEKSMAESVRAAAPRQDPAPVVNETPQMDELGQIRQCVSEFDAELRESASRQSTVIKRVSSLNSLITKMELDLKQLRRLQIENKNLSRSVVDLESKIAQKSSWASELESKLSDLGRRHTLTRDKLELAQASLAAAHDNTTNQDGKIIDQDRSIRALKSRAETGEEKIKHAEFMLQTLRDNLSAQGTELAQKNRESIELRNSLEELTTKYDRNSKKAEATLVELKNLRLDFNEMKTKHVGVIGKLENAKYELRTQRTVFDETVRRREEETLALKTHIDQLDTQMEIKENMASHLDQEFITLRDELSNERDRTAALEQRLAKKTDESERSSQALVKAKSEFEQLSSNFASTLDEFEALRRVNQSQREKLERYAQIGGVSSGQALLNMEITPVEKDQTLSIAEDSENVTVLKTGTKPRKIS